MHPAFLYRPGDKLTLPELAAARIDGHVVEVGGAYIPADLVEGADVSANVVASLLRPGTAAAGPTAAWIYGAGDAPPTVHHIQRFVERRLRPPPDALVMFHDTMLTASDIRVIDGVPVSTPLRTMVDIAIALHRDPSLLPWVHGLAELAPTLPGQAIAALRARERVPGIRTALAALEATAVRTT